MELYETFHWLRRQRTWGEYPLGCTCSTCGRNCLCLYSALVTSLFKKSVQVPTNWVAATPALSKKSNRLRGSAGPRRARLIEDIAKEKTKSASKLSYINAPIPPTPEPALRGTGKPVLVIPQAESLSPSSSSSEENEVLIVIDARLPILISSRQGPAPRPAPCDGPRPRLKRKVVLLEDFLCTAENKKQIPTYTYMYMHIHSYT